MTVFAEKGRNKMRSYLETKKLPIIIITAFIVTVTVVGAVFSHFGGFGTGETADIKEYEKYAVSVADITIPEDAMSRTMSPMMVSQYQLQLPDKEVLRKKLQELANIPQIEDKE